MNVSNLKRTSNPYIIDCDIEHPKYGLIQTSVNIQLDGDSLPIDDRQDIALSVIDSINSAEEYIPYTPTDEEKIEGINRSIQAMLNTKAQAKGYDSIHTAALRAALPGSPFHAEGVAFGEWMDQCNAKCYELLAQWQAGEIQEMTPEEVLAVMPECPVPV